MHQGDGGPASSNAAKTWLQGLGVTFPVLHEEDPYPIFNSYTRVAGLPHSYVIGRDMIIRVDKLGYGGGADPCGDLEGEILDVVYMRHPVDMAMVLDISNSMNYPSPSDPGGDTKLTMMHRASEMIVNFLKDHGQVDDRMGVVWFTDDVKHFEESGQSLLSVQGKYSEIIGAVTATETGAVETGTCTAMGAGLIRGFDMLSASSSRRHAIAVTDGMQNVEPKVTQVGDHLEIIDSSGYLCGPHSSEAERPGVDIRSYDTRVHPIGVGVTANYATLLQEIADQTRGVYIGTDDPENDLDLIYFVDLCNCLAGGSPTIIHHSIGTFLPERCQTIEQFCINRTVRKLSVLLSWKKTQECSLTFWLYTPDGTLLDLSAEMRMFDDHCMATIYLPRNQSGHRREHVGEWKVIIRGETGQVPADYHLLVVGEDRVVKHQLDFPRRLYAVGDILPLVLELKEEKNVITRINEIVLEKASHRVPITDVVSKCRITSYEAMTRLKVDPNAKYNRDPMLLKLEAMSVDPRYQLQLKPTRTLHSLKRGDFECMIGKREITVPIQLEEPGLNSYKVSVHCETPGNGPIQRVDMISLCVRPGKVQKSLSSVSKIVRSTRRPRSWWIDLTPKNSHGQLLGPGHASEISAVVGEKAIPIEVEDRLDGSYRVELKEPPKPKKRTKAGPPPIKVLFQGVTMWKQEV